MDLQLYARVLWRFKALVLGGLVLALTLALLSFVRLNFTDGRLSFAYRDAERWQSRSVILITQRGFPWGRAIPKYAEADPEAGVPAVPLGDQGRFAGLSLVYSHLANSDAVLSQLASTLRRMRGTVEATAISDPNGATLPLIAINTSASSGRDAVILARRATAIFRNVVLSEQRQADIRPDERVVLQVLADGERPILSAPRKKTFPIFIFLAVMTVTIGLAFVLENVRPLVRGVPADEESPRATAEARGRAA